MTVRIEQGDCREVIPTLGVTVDAVVCDPPYDLVSMTKRFGKPGSAVATSADHGRFARGFMGQQWDGEGVAFDPETWRIVGSVLRPGGIILAFGAPRTHHRLATAIEDAGFVIQDCLMWLFATGFPKRKDMLKPAYEPIVMAYKPGGARTLQIDECRVESEARPWREPASDQEKEDGNVYGGGLGRSRFAVQDTTIGRWPANVCHDGSGEVVELFPTSAGQQGDVRGTEPSEVTKDIYGKYGPRPPAPRRNEPSADRRYTDRGASDFAMLPGARRSDAGSAARFFYSAKAGTQDRWGSKHPTVKPVDLMKWLIALVTPPGGLVLDPFAGSGTTGVAALATGRNCILIERSDEYIADIRERMGHYEGSGRHSLAAKNRNAREKVGSLL